MKRFYNLCKCFCNYYDFNISAETILPMYVQTARGYSALTTGIMLLLGAIVMEITLPIAGMLFDKLGAKKLAIPGTLIILINTIYFTMIDETSLVVCWSYIWTFTCFNPITTHAFYQIHVSLNAHGSAMLNTMQQVSTSIGTAILVSFLYRVANNSPSIICDRAPYNLK
ncbi:MAG: MFS transporter [Bacillota bacterium]